MGSEDKIETRSDISEIFEFIPIDLAVSVTEKKDYTYISIGKGIRYNQRYPSTMYTNDMFRAFMEFHLPGYLRAVENKEFVSVKEFYADCKWCEGGIDSWMIRGTAKVRPLPEPKP